MKYKVLYSPQYDCLMLAYPIYKGSHWYKFEGDPWDYGGGAAHKMDFLKETANFIVIDEWNEEQEKLTNPGCAGDPVDTFGGSDY